MSARNLLALQAASRAAVRRPVASSSTLPSSPSSSSASSAAALGSRRYATTFPTGNGGGGLLPPGGAIRGGARRRWPAGASGIHNLPVATMRVRHASWARALPKLATKLVRIPAMAGATVVGGVAYIQYQAAQAGSYAVGVFENARDTASSWASGLWDGANGIAGQVGTGWERTKDKANQASQDLEMPEWMAKIMFPQDGQSGGSGGGGGPNGGGPEPSQAKSGAAAGVATGAAFGYSQSGEDDERTEGAAARDDQMMMLTKKMIEIRNILQQVGQTDVLTLPSIVVIGSQSSGKSSVLEAIVGHEFLPKGSNMVTRRPIELTLVNTPDGHAEYGEFPALGLGKITDFAHIQKTLTDLNLAVPAQDCVSDDPIQLHIYSPNVPDLSLIDLPGYIQVAGADQPVELKQKISDLCDKYIQPPNVILAISAADVDLANSTALRSSRRVDPRGERTIGVITKMDLVDPERGSSMLNDRKYPLRLGYVGVITKAPPATGGLFSRGSGNITSAVTKNENAFFSAHPLEFNPSEVSVGTTTLRKKLMTTLEQVMASSLQPTSDLVRQELEEATYEFKVQYNDRPLSAESYLAESLDAFKHSFKELTETFGRPQVRELLKRELDQRVMDLLAQRYWNKPIDDLSAPVSDRDPLGSLPSADPESLVWHRRLDASSSSLTKLGIGRLATTVVANALQTRIEELIEGSTFATHPFAREAIHAAATGILNDRFYSTSDQVENCIKPYKFEIEVDDAEWAKGRANVTGVLKKELSECEAAHKRVADTVGGKRKLNDVVAFIDRVRKGDVVLEGNGVGGAGGFSAALLAKGREAAFLRDRADLIKMRLTALKQKQCNNKSNKYYCPEVFLDVVADKLVATSVLFLNVELLSEFYYNFPRELDARLGRHLSKEEVERFAREDPRIRGHLDVIRRKELLEMVLEKMESLRQLEGRERRDDVARSGYGRNGQRSDKPRGGWGIF